MTLLAENFKRMRKRYTRRREIIEGSELYIDIYPDQACSFFFDPLKKERERAVKQYVDSFDYILHDNRERRKTIKRIEKMYS